MIEKLVNSKTRLKILQHFLSHIDDRYYLRELERMLEESLSPLRRQLLKLEAMGILTVEEEANVKYYKLNKDFEGLEELKTMVLGQEVLDSATVMSSRDRSNGIILRASGEAASREEKESSAPKDEFKERLDNIILEAASAPKAEKRIAPQMASLAVSVASLIIVLTAALLVYSNAKNIKQMASLITKEEVLDSATVTGSRDRSNTNILRASGEAASREEASYRSSSNGEMTSKKWKLFPGNIPVLSGGETEGEKKSKEL
ncbi:MAG: winged helix-turn-helix domain-containing protein [Candidatus Omnitrophota bacterium]|nr:winged helix-turn-helix domain-containing protein [Candidatus Omnitrophota bacterium]